MMNDSVHQHHVIFGPSWPGGDRSLGLAQIMPVSLTLVTRLFLFQLSIMQIMSGKMMVALLPIVHLIVTANCMFDEAPAPQIVADGEKATFRCRHSSADSIRWKVDHDFITANPPPDITPNFVREMDGVIVHTLTIIAHSEYNGRVIECVAVFDDQTPNEQTSPVVLQVITGAIVGSFIETPSSLNTSFGETAFFFCQHQNADHLIWNVTPSNLSSHFNQSSRGGRYKLSAHLTEDTVNYNATNIQCLAFFDDSPVQATDPVTLLIQGPLDAIGNLKENETTISWEPPYSLDLTYANPDIAYCVDIYNITCGRRDLIISDCNVTEPSYTSDDIAPHGYIYEYAITPRSNVPGARNGTSVTMKDKFPVSGNWTFENLWDSKAFLATHVDTALKLPFSYTLSLEPLDGKRHTHRPMITADRNGSTVYFDISSVPPRRLFTCTMLAYDCTDDSSFLATFELSTHDIRNLSVVGIRSRIIIRGHFIDKSEAGGLLVIVYNIHDPNLYSPQYHLIPRHRRGTKRQKLKFELTGLGAGEVSIAVFVVEKNGLPFPRVATRPKIVYISNSSSNVSQQPFALIEYSVQSNMNGVCVTCNFKRNSSTTDCLVVVHQRISQVNLSGLMSIEANWTHRFTRQGDTASGCIRGLDLELYQVGVANGRQMSVVVIPPPKYITAVVTTVVVLSILLLGVILATIIAMIYYYCVRTKGIDLEALPQETDECSTRATLNEYVELRPDIPAILSENSGAKQADDLPTYIADVQIQSAECEEQSENCSNLTNGGGGGVKGESSSLLSMESQTLDQKLDTSGVVYREQHPSERSDSCDNESPCSCKPIEAMDQPVKTVVDMDASEDVNQLLQSAVIGFNVLSEKRETPFLGRDAHKVYQPVTTQLHNQKLGEEVALPGRHRASSLVVRRNRIQVSTPAGLRRTNSLVLMRDCIKMKDLIGESGNDTNVKLKATDEFVTGRS